MRIVIGLEVDEIAKHKDYLDSISKDLVNYALDTDKKSSGYLMIEVQKDKAIEVIKELSK